MDVQYYLKVCEPYTFDDDICFEHQHRLDVQTKRIMDYGEGEP